MIFTSHLNCLLDGFQAVNKIFNGKIPKRKTESSAYESLKSFAPALQTRKSVTRGVQQKRKSIGELSDLTL
jgi:hypothetical protein